MRTKTPVVPTEEEKVTLEKWIRSSTTEQRLVTRAKIILFSSMGITVKEICRRLEVDGKTCYLWRKRFSESGIDGLFDLKGRGKKPGISPLKRLEVIGLACSEPVDSSTRWSVRKLAAETGISKSAVQKILSEASLKPHKTDYWCGKSKDPLFEEKQADIVGLYLNPPENALVLSVDEKTSIQALDRTRPELPMIPESPRRLTATYKRNGTTCLLAALKVHEGEVTAKCVDKNNHQEFLRFLKKLYRENPYKHLHIILDNLAVHKHQKIKEWASHRKRLTFHFTPTYASWLNQVEIRFNILTRDVLKDGIWQSKKELVKQLLSWVKYYNENRAKPFNWNYTGKPLVE